jgi:hypothetical protein
MPPTFPQNAFQEFGKRASKFFPTILSDDDLNDPLQKRQHFERAWLAVRYRYRACSEYNEEYKALLVNPSDLWREWSADEEQNYQLEKSLYQFFMSGLSVFESLGFCLYFVGSMVCPNHFPFVSNPKRITSAATSKAFTAAFPYASITNHLAELSRDTEYRKIDTIRNILAHRLTGRRNVHGDIKMHAGVIVTHTRKEFWRVLGSDEELIFDKVLIQRHLDEINSLLTTLISASLEFVESVSLSASP